MGWAPQPPGSWPYLELANQRIDELRAEADHARTVRASRRSRSRRARARARRWLQRPAALAASVNRLVGGIISPPWRPTTGSRRARGRAGTRRRSSAA
jgi:hypothetical protein